MANDKVNEAARKALDDEKAKFGFNRQVPGAEKEESDLEDEDQDETTDEEEENEDLDSDTEDADDSEESDEEDEDTEEATHKKGKTVPISEFNKLRTQKREADAKLEEALKKNKDLESKIPDDFEERTDALMKEIGVEDPENTKKIIKFVKEAALGNVKDLEEKLANLEKIVEQSKRDNIQIVDEFPEEWKTFEKDILSEEFPNATREEIKEMRTLMEGLAKDPKTGGKTYKHESGETVLDPYPLDYILFKNKKKFEELATTRVSSGMESGRTQTGKRENDGEIKHVNSNSPASAIINLDKKYARMEADMKTLRSPETSTI